jgi:hypothetical protein
MPVLHSLDPHVKRGILANLRNSRNRGLYPTAVGRPRDRGELKSAHTHGQANELRNSENCVMLGLRTFAYRCSIRSSFPHSTTVSATSLLAWLDQIIFCNPLDHHRSLPTSLRPDNQIISPRLLPANYAIDQGLFPPMYMLGVWGVQR